MPSGETARLLTPVGLTQAKGMSKDALWSLHPLTFARFVDRRAVGGPAKVT